MTKKKFNKKNKKDFHAIYSKYIWQIGPSNDITFWLSFNFTQKCVYIYIYVHTEAIFTNSKQVVEVSENKYSTVHYSYGEQMYIIIVIGYLTMYFLSAYTI